MDTGSPEQLVRTRYAEVLRNLRSPAGSGKMIQNLTLLAEDQRHYAHIIASVILEEIPRSDIPRKYVLLCLVDSIVRKCRSGPTFFPYFLPYIAPYFAEAYTTKTPTQILRSLEKLLKVWNDSFPRDIVKKLISTTNSVRSKLNEPPIELEIKSVSNNSVKQSTEPSPCNNTQESSKTQKEANILSDIYTQVSKSIIQKANVIDENNVLLGKLMKDPNVHKIALLSSQGRLQESQSLFNILVANLENSKTEIGNSAGTFQPPQKRIKQDNLENNTDDDNGILNKAVISHTVPQTNTISGKSLNQVNLVQANIQNTVIGAPQTVPPILTSSGLSPSPATVSAAAAAAAAAAAKVAQSKVHVQQKHSSALIHSQSVIITSQVKTSSNQSMPTQLANSNGISNPNTQIKKTFSPRFSENNTSSILLSIWNQLFKHNDKFGNVDIKGLRRIDSSIIDGKGDQNIFIEGLHINEISDLFLLYKKLQENVDASILFKKTVWLKSHFIKRRMIDNTYDFNFQSNISMYYFDRPNQCHTCGYRFTDSKKKESHIQIHLSKNLVFKQKKQTWSSQILWPNLQDWIYSLDNSNENNYESYTDNSDSCRDKTGCNISEIGSSLRDVGVSSQNDKGINYSDLYEIILNKFTRIKNESNYGSSDSNQNKLNDCVLDDNYNQSSSDIENRNLKGDLLLMHYINCIEGLNSANSNKTIKDLVSSDILEYTSNYVNEMVIKDVDNVCNSISSLLYEMTQSVSSSCTPIDPLHMTCDICHESLKIKWSSFLKSWVSVDAVALTFNDIKEFISEGKDEFPTQKLSLAVLDQSRDTDTLDSSNAKEKIVNNMLRFIQWKLQNVPFNNNKKIEFKPFDTDYYNYNIFINHNQGIIGDSFVTAHKSCFIHYFIYSEISLRLPINYNINKKKRYINKNKRELLVESYNTSDNTRTFGNFARRFSFI